MSLQALDYTNSGEFTIIPHLACFQRSMATLETRTLIGYRAPYRGDSLEITIDRKNNKLIVMPTNDSEHDEAAARGGLPGKLLIISHGNEDTAGGSLTPALFAKAVKNSTLWRPGIPIVHDACNLGKKNDGFAQQMSNLLGVAYTAPTSYSWRKWSIIGGGSFIADTTTGGNFPNIFSRGSWRTFYPQYTEVNPRLRR
jgi:hypothetical protein